MVEQRLSSPDESAASAAVDDVELIEPDRTSEVEQETPAISEPAKVFILEKVVSPARQIHSTKKYSHLDHKFRFCVKC